MNQEKHPAEEAMRNAVEALISSSGRIRERLQDAARHIGEVAHDQMRGPIERDLDLRIRAGLVEGGDDEDDEDAEDADYADVAAAIAMLEESRATEIASDIFRLYEVVARGDQMLVEHAKHDRPTWKFGNLAQNYASVAAQDLEPIVREAAQAIDADEATTKVLHMHLMQAWAAGALAASDDAAIAKAARLARVVKRILPEVGK